MYRLREDRDIRPSVLANMISTLMYEKRYVVCSAHLVTLRFGPYFVEPLICGMDKDDKVQTFPIRSSLNFLGIYLFLQPYICAMDLLGAPLLAADFVLIGTSASEALYGICESLYKPDMVVLLNET